MLGEISVSMQSMYNKLNGLEAKISAEWVRFGAQGRDRPDRLVEK